MFLLTRILSIEVVGAAALLVEFSNGAKATFDLTQWIAGGSPTLDPLNEPEVFATAEIGFNGRAVIWNARLDLAIDAVNLAMQPRVEAQP